MNTLLSALGSTQACALIYDAVGIFILGWPTMFMSPRRIALQGFMNNSLGPNMWEMMTLVETRLDITIGSLVLFLGFVLQFTSQWGVQSMPPWAGLVLGIAPIIFALVYLFAGLRKRLLKRVSRRVDALLYMADAQNTLAQHDTFSTVYGPRAYNPFHKQKARCSRK